MRMTDARSPQATVIAVTSGKGGVGKTHVAINISVALARLGRRVALIDGDWALGNVDVMLGLTPLVHIGHVLSGERRLDEVLIDGPRGLRVLPAGSGVPALTALSTEQRRRLDAAMVSARAAFEFLVIDTAPGIADNVLEILKNAQHVLLVTSLDPAAMVDAYALTKVLWSSAPRCEISLVANSVRDGAEGRLAFRQIDRAATRFLGTHLRYLGHVPDDPAVRDAICHQRALVDHAPHTPASRSLRLLATRLASLKAGPEGVSLMPAAGPACDNLEVGQCA
jgi:flagellar biosynthesis protein FlhG